MSETNNNPENESQNTEQQYVRTPVTPEELAQNIAESQTHKLKEGEEINGIYMGCFSVDTQFGKGMQHAFRPGGSEEGDRPIYYWSNWSMDKAITDAKLSIMDACRIRRMANNVYVVDIAPQ